jgi:hypothetical protein
MPRKLTEKSIIIASLQAYCRNWLGKFSILRCGSAFHPIHANVTDAIGLPRQGKRVY